MAEVQRDPECREKQELIHQIRNLYALITAIRYEELDALITGDSSILEQYANQLQEAMERKKSLAKQIERHVREHGC